MSHHPSRSAYTLIEILVATAVSMILMLAIMRMFGGIGESLNRTRAEMNLALELRRVEDLLERDLDNRSMPVVTTEQAAGVLGRGYFTYQEGQMWTPSENEPRLQPTATPPATPRTAIELLAAVKGTAPYLATPYLATPLTPTQQNWCSLNVAINPDTGFPDSTVGDLDDFLAFTVEAKTGVTPYRARGLDVENSPKIGIVESTQAEVAWFVRGTTLYRRILLIDQYANDPKRLSRVTASLTNDRTTSVLNRADLVLFWNNQPAATMWKDANDLDREATFYDAFDYSVQVGAGLAPNLLNSLDNRQNRFGMLGTFPFPCVALPRLEDQIAGSSLPCTILPGYPVDPATFEASPPDGDYWNWDDVPSDAPRRSEDVVMKNVLSFDVKAWIDNDDFVAPGTIVPGYFADLGWRGVQAPTKPEHNDFSNTGRYAANTPPMSNVYDTWWNTVGGAGVDEPPYGTKGNTVPAPLRAVQITIRAYEPQFKTVQEVRVVKRLEQ